MSSAEIGFVSNDIRKILDSCKLSEPDRLHIKDIGDSLCNSLARTAGMSWLGVQLDVNKRHRDVLSALMLLYQEKGWQNLHNLFKRTLNSADVNPDKNTLMAFHLCGLIQQTVRFIKISLFSLAPQIRQAFNVSHCVTSEQSENCKNLLSSERRLSRFALDIVIWQRRLCDKFNVVPKMDKRQPATKAGPAYLCTKRRKVTDASL
jgi:hypothetical protein